MTTLNRTPPMPALAQPSTPLVEAVAGGIALSHARYTAGANTTPELVQANLTPLRRFEAVYALAAIEQLVPPALWQQVVAAARAG